MSSIEAVKQGQPTTVSPIASVPNNDPSTDVANRSFTERAVSAAGGLVTNICSLPSSAVSKVVAIAKDSSVLSSSSSTTSSSQDSPVEIVVPSSYSSNQQVAVTTNIFDQINKTIDVEALDQLFASHPQAFPCSENLVGLILQKIISENRFDIFPVFFKYQPNCLKQLSKAISICLQEKHEPARWIALKLIAKGDLDPRDLLEEVLCGTKNVYSTLQKAVFVDLKSLCGIEIDQVFQIVQKIVKLNPSVPGAIIDLFKIPEQLFREKVSFVNQLLDRKIVIAPIDKTKFNEKAKQLEAYSSLVNAILTETDSNKLDAAFAAHKDLLDYSDVYYHFPLEYIFERRELKLLSILSKYPVSNWNLVPKYLGNLFKAFIFHVDLRPLLIRLIASEKLDPKELLDEIKGVDACSYISLELEKIINEKMDKAALTKRANEIENAFASFTQFAKKVKDVKYSEELELLLSENRSLLVYDASYSKVIVTMIFPLLKISALFKYPELDLSNFPPLKMVLNWSSWEQANQLVTYEVRSMLLKLIASDRWNPQRVLSSLGDDTTGRAWEYDLRRCIVDGVFSKSKALARAKQLDHVMELHQKLDECDSPQALAELNKLLEDHWADEFFCTKDFIKRVLNRDRSKCYTEVLALFSKQFSSKSSIISWFPLSDQPNMGVRFLLLRLREHNKILLGHTLNNLLNNHNILIRKEAAKMIAYDLMYLYKNSLREFLYSSTLPKDWRMLFINKLAFLLNVTQKEITNRLVNEENIGESLENNALQERLKVLEIFLKIETILFSKNNELSISDRVMVEELIASVSKTQEYAQGFIPYLCSELSSNNYWNSFLFISSKYDPSQLYNIHMRNCPEVILDKLIDQGELDPMKLFTEVINGPWRLLPALDIDFLDEESFNVVKSTVPLLRKLISRINAPEEVIFDMCKLENYNHLPRVPCVDFMANVFRNINDQKLLDKLWVLSGRQKQCSVM